VIYDVLFVPPADGKGAGRLVMLSEPQRRALVAVRAADRGKRGQSYALLSNVTKPVVDGETSCWEVSSKAIRLLEGKGLVTIKDLYARLTPDGRAARKPTSAELDRLEQEEGRAP
jgi:hypothetical protein